MTSPTDEDFPRGGGTMSHMEDKFYTESVNQVNS